MYSIQLNINFKVNSTRSPAIKQSWFLKLRVWKSVKWNIVIN